MEAIQAHIIFKGHVQGVGFRFTAQRIALDLGVCGWVKNLYNSDVEVVVEADREVVEKFLGKIKSHFSRYIINEDIDISKATGSLKGFEIRF